MRFIPYLWYNGLHIGRVCAGGVCQLRACFFGEMGLLVQKKRIFLVFITLLCPVFALAQADTRLWDTGSAIEPSALFYAGIYDLRVIDPNLTGAGVKIASVCRSETYVEGQPQDDYFWNLIHPCFSKSKIRFIDHINNAGLSQHATAIGSILTGRDNMGFHPEVGDFRYEGVAPNASVDVYEFWRFVCKYASGAKKLDADVLTMSVGVIFEDWWTRGIERMAEEDGIVVVAGIGNGDEVCDPAYYPAVGANVIGVGIVDCVKDKNAGLSLREFSLPSKIHSSYGPTPDGRCGPDIVAPGKFLVAGVDSDEGYEITGNWSSFATPVVAGTVGLLVQEAKADEELAGAVARDGGNCVMKAILLNSATKLPYWHKGEMSKDDDHNFSLDFVQGAGVVNSVGAFDQLIAGRQEPGEADQIGWDNNELEKNLDAVKVYRIAVDEPEDKFIVSTLVWNRHYEDKYPFSGKYDKDGDLRLEVWAVDDENPDKSYMIDHSDSVNDNIEHIYSACDPNFSVYEIIISSNQNEASMDFGEFERYGLAWDVREEDSKGSVFWYDLSGDGIVGVEDIDILFEKMKAEKDVEKDRYLGDINMDGAIDVADMVMMVNRMVIREQRVP